MPAGSLENVQIAERLRAAGELLEQQGDNPFRAAAYRRAAEKVARLEVDLRDLEQRRGLEGLIALPTIGPGIGRAIQEMLRTGQWTLLERLRGTLEPEKLLQTVPGIGPELARRLHEGLGIDTLEALEVAAHDGRVRTVPGVGQRRAASLRATLEGLLGRHLRRPRLEPAKGPGVAVLLDVDREYRARAAAHQLPTIAPRRFNPEAKAWLPILHTMRGEWHFTALFSNTARAHELGRTHDWVVLYFDDDHLDGQHTVVTETHGALAGRRVVRGRETECRALYDRQRSSTGDYRSRETVASAAGAPAGGPP